MAPCRPQARAKIAAAASASTTPTSCTRLIRSWRRNLASRRVAAG